jgi:hypothetical protein
MATRRSLRWVSISSLFILGASAGCDSLAVNPFSGTLMEMRLQGVAVTPPGQHLELWARDGYDDILRINPFYDEASNKTSYGQFIRQAISLDDPCLIDDAGNLLTSAAAYPGDVTINGITQTPDEQAQQVINRRCDSSRTQVCRAPRRGLREVQSEAWRRERAPLVPVLFCICGDDVPARKRTVVVARSAAQANFVARDVHRRLEVDTGKRGVKRSVRRRGVATVGRVSRCGRSGAARRAASSYCTDDDAVLAFVPFFEAWMF